MTNNNAFWLIGSVRALSPARGGTTPAGGLDVTDRRLFPSQEEDRPKLEARSAAALHNARREGIKLADHIAGAVTCMSHEAVQTPCAEAPLQYGMDSGHAEGYSRRSAERYWTLVQCGRREPLAWRGCHAIDR